MKYIEILDRIEKDSYFELNYTLTIDLPANLQPYYNNQTTLSKSGVISCENENTPSVIKQRLINLWQGFNDGIINQKRWKFYGTYFDGTTWITGGTN